MGLQGSYQVQISVHTLWLLADVLVGLLTMEVGVFLPLLPALRFFPSYWVTLVNLEPFTLSYYVFGYLLFSEGKWRRADGCWGEGKGRILEEWSEEKLWSGCMNERRICFFKYIFLVIFPQNSTKFDGSSSLKKRLRGGIGRSVKEPHTSFLSSPLLLMLRRFRSG